MTVIGLTGGFGTGKSLVASIFKSLGAKVLDADRIAHAELEKRSRSHTKIARTFGSGVVGVGGSIDRKALAEVVFKNRKRLNKLNTIIHPQVIRHIKKRIKTAGKKSVVVVDAPLLIEAGLTGFVDILVVVKAPRSKQLKRCIDKFGITRNECMRRIDSQMPMGVKLRLADYVINNAGTMSRTRKQVVRIWKNVISRKTS